MILTIKTKPISNYGIQVSFYSDNISWGELTMRREKWGVFKRLLGAGAASLSDMKVELVEED